MRELKPCPDCKKIITKPQTMNWVRYNNKIRCRECTIKINVKNISGKRGENHPRWKGGRTIWDGYVFIKVKDHPHAPKNGYMGEHRLVMEKHLGRYLSPGEVVHHINENRQDNRIENLQLFSSPGEHTKTAHAELYERQKQEFKGKRFSPETEFKPGMIPWNKK